VGLRKAQQSNMAATGATAAVAAAVAANAAFTLMATLTRTASLQLDDAYS